MSSISFQSPEHALREGVKAIFERWTALELTIEHQMGGNPQIINRMIDTTVNLLTSAKPKYSVDDIADYFYEEFDKMMTDIEDGSAEQVADNVVKVRDAAALGDFSVAAGFVQKSASGSTSAKKESVLGRQEESDEPMDRTDKEVADEKRLEPTVDEDGFTVVGKRRGHR